MVTNATRALAFVSGAVLGLQLEAQQPAPREWRPAQREEMTPELRLAVARGFQFLVRQQLRSGDFDSEYPVAADALVGIAFLAGGHSEKAGGEFTEVIRRGTSALLRRQNPKGYFDDGKCVMYGHGFATLYLAELYGTSEYRQSEIREALVKALRVIEGSQSNSGGWDYLPAREFGVFEGPVGTSDTSITVCQTMALRAAKNLGIEISDRVVSRAKAYIEQAQKPEGDFSYREGRPSLVHELSSFPRSAAGTCILYSLARPSDYNSTKLKAGLEFLSRSYTFPWSNQFPYYGHYYCAQAMFQAGGRYWKDYFPWIRAELLRLQRSDGSWQKSARENSMQCTAMAMIVLQLPYRFLPIHER